MILGLYNVYDRAKWPDPIHAEYLRLLKIEREERAKPDRIPKWRWSHKSLRQQARKNVRGEKQ